MALPNFRVQIDKSILSQHWSNDYLLTAADLLSASNDAQAIVAMERSIHGSVVNFNYVRTSTLTVGDRSFIHAPINLTGQIDYSGFEYLPLFNTVRVDLGTAGSDPARKYYRIPVLEVNQVNGKLTTAIMASITAQVQNILPAGSTAVPLVTTKGNVVVNASVHPDVQMRQLYRRGKKKVSIP